MPECGFSLNPPGLTQPHIPLLGAHHVMTGSHPVIPMTDTSRLKQPAKNATTLYIKNMPKASMLQKPPATAAIIRMKCDCLCSCRVRRSIKNAVRAMTHERPSRVMPNGCLRQICTLIHCSASPVIPLQKSTSLRCPLKTAGPAQRTVLKPPAMRNLPGFRKMAISVESSMRTVMRLFLLKS